MLKEIENMNIFVLLDILLVGAISAFFLALIGLGVIVLTGQTQLLIMIPLFFLGIPAGVLILVWLMHKLREELA